MRILSLPACLGVSVLSGMTFVLGAIIGNLTYDEATPKWMRACILAPKPDRETVAVITCDDVTQDISAVPKLMIAVLPSDGVAVVCNGYETLVATISLDCHTSIPK